MASIIYVDNEPQAIDRTLLVLEAAGHDVQPCGDGAAALEAFSDSSAQLVLAALDLGDMDATALCRALRQQPRSCLTPVVIVASDHQPDQIIEVLSNGADDVIRRPYADDALVATIADALDKTAVRVRQGAALRDPDLFIGSYEIITDLGSGSFSTVYHAIDRANDGDVALKVFDTAKYEPLSVSFNACFLREAYEMSKLDHPNIVKLLDFGKHQTSFYMVMEFIRGQSLDALVRQGGVLDEENLILLAYQVTLAYECLEQHNAVHRDIKPDNIMIAENGDVKLTDFGLAKQQDDSSLTQVHHQFMGTPNFVAPEQIQGRRDIDVRCDIYSLGATLFFCATMALPFAAEGIVETLANNMSEDLPALVDVAPDISREFSDVVVHMLMKEPEDRCTPAELKASLLQLMER